ncbi:MAG: type I-C CRISPR-associated endonuclease Cas1c [Lentisphaeria bacterium]
MKKLLNTLYITTQGAYLRQEGECVVVEVERQERLRLPLHTLGGIVAFGNVLCSPFLLGLCGERGVQVSFLTERGQFLARVQGPVSGNILLRREQYRRAELPDAALAIAKNILTAKLANGRTVLQRSLRDHPESDADGQTAKAIARLGHTLDTLDIISDREVLRGIEGDAAKLYFSVFDRMVTTEKDAFFMRERSRRPPLDNLNALLSFLYTLLAHDAEAACEGVGLDPQQGFLHAVRPGRPSLALDLMEEFRPVIADRLALSLINLRQVAGKGFKTTETGAVTMDDETRKAVLIAYQKRKQDEIRHPFLQEDVPVGLLLHVQALLLARHLRGDLDAYPPFVWK